MTPEQINVAIAEHCGWRNVRELDDLYPDGSVAAGIWWQGVDPSDSQERAILDYVGDLNAMHEAERLMDFAQCNLFTKQLRAIGDANAEFMGHEAENFDWHSTAMQRAEAFLRTIGKWKEDEA